MTALPATTQLHPTEERPNHHDAWVEFFRLGIRYARIARQRAAAREAATANADNSTTDQTERRP